MKTVNRVKLLFVILVLGVFMRGYQAVERFSYTHDSDLAAWIVKDIVVDGHLRLIGQQTSQIGIFIGPLFYYSLIPLYLAYNFDPIGTLWFGIILGIFAIVSVYYVFNKLFGKQGALIGSLLYATSWGISSSEREVVPTAPVSLWTVWYLYATTLVYQGRPLGLYIAAILVSLIWHLNLALILLMPILIIGIIKNIQQFNIKHIVASLVLTALLSTPLLVFEIRHNFSQTSSLISSLTERSESSTNIVDKFDRVLYLSMKNINLLVWDKPEQIGVGFMVTIIVLATIVGIVTHKDKNLQFISSLWILLYLVFFSMHSIIVSEYYLHGMNIIWLVGITLLLSKIQKPAWALPLILLIFIAHNIYSFVTSPINKNGYLERTAIVKEIQADAKSRGYPCVAVSYMTDPGYELGYRYLFWKTGLHVNRPLRESPVYTIVFPHTRANKLDKTFGAIGLVTPDYSRYTEDAVASSCSGENENLTEPMFGFTK